MVNFKTTCALAMVAGSISAFAGEASDFCHLDRMRDATPDDLFYSVGNRHADSISCQGNTLLNRAIVANAKIEVVQELLDMDASAIAANGLELISQARQPELYDLVSGAVEAEEAEGEYVATGDHPDSGPGKFYVGADFMHTLANSMEHEGSDTDVPTDCDQFLAGALPLSHPDCIRSQDKWGSTTDFLGGENGGLKVGYSFGDDVRRGLRVEAEYFAINRKGQPTDSSSLGADLNDKDRELIILRDDMPDVRSRHLAVNAFWDVPIGDTAYDFTFGGGGGFANKEIHYSAAWGRNPDRSVMESIGRNVNAAGTTTWTEDNLEDNVGMYQVMAGVRRWIGDRAVLGVKARYVGYTDFADGGPWGVLRGHSSHVGPGGDDVIYTKEVSGKEQGNFSVGADFSIFLGN